MSGMHLLDIPHWVYRQYDSNGRLLYVGVTYQPEVRAYRHALNTAWYHEINRTDLTEFPTGPAAYAAEKDAIRSECPKYNMKSNPANAHITLPPKSYMLPASQFTKLIHETVNAAERAS